MGGEQEMEIRAGGGDGRRGSGGGDVVVGWTDSRGRKRRRKRGGAGGGGFPRFSAVLFVHGPHHKGRKCRHCCCYVMSSSRS